MTGKKKTGGGKNLRAGISAHELIRALELHVLGEREMKPTQVSAALALLKKILPDADGKEGKLARGTKIAHEDALDALE